MSNSFIIGHTQARPGAEPGMFADPHAHVPLERNAPVKLDIPTLLDTRMIVCANSGGGKSWLFRLIAERTGKRVPTWVIDPEGEYASLRERLELAVVGGNGEIPLTVNSAALTARRLYESGVGAVFDLSDLDLDAKRAAVDRLLTETLRVAKHPAHPLFVFVDEAHQLCPQVGQVESSDAIKRMMDTGRKREICGLLATQRVTKLHNDAIGEARNVAIGLTVLGADQERAGDLLGMNKQQRAGLAGLGKGEFYLYGPAVLAPGVSFFKSDQVETTHPQPGKRHLIEVPPASDAIKKLLGQLGDLPAQAQEESNALAAAQKEVIRLQHELTARPTQVRTAPPQVEIRIVEKPVLNGEVHDLRAAVGTLQATLAPLQQLPDLLQPVSGALAAILRKVEIVEQAQRAHVPTERNASLRVAPAVVPAAPRVSADTQTADGLTAPQQRILDVLSEFEALGIRMPDKSNVAVFADVSPKSSGYQNNLGRLRTLGYVDYPGSGRLMLTDAGRAAANPAGHIRSLADLHEAWYAKLPRPQSKILQQVIAAYPHPVGKNNLAELAGQSATSSGYQNNLGALRSLGLIDYPRSGFVVATALLFPEGLS